MMEYVKPAYEKEGVETSDVILASLGIVSVGEGTLGNITGAKAQVSASFDDLFGTR